MAPKRAPRQAGFAFSTWFHGHVPTDVPGPDPRASRAQASPCRVQSTQPCAGPTREELKEKTHKASAGMSVRQMGRPKGLQSTAVLMVQAARQLSEEDLLLLLREGWCKTLRCLGKIQNPAALLEVMLRLLPL